MRESFPLRDLHVNAFVVAEVRKRLLQDFLGRRFDHSPKQSHQFRQMLPCSGMNDQGTTFAATFDPLDSETIALEPSPDLGGAEVDGEVAGFGGHGGFRQGVSQK